MALAEIISRKQWETREQSIELDGPLDVVVLNPNLETTIDILFRDPIECLAVVVKWNSIREVYEIVDVIDDDDEEWGGTMDSIGTEAEKLHTSIVNLVRGRGLISADDLKREAASMSGLGGAAGNAVAAVAIKQLVAAGRIQRSASGHSYQVSCALCRKPAPTPHVDQSGDLYCSSACLRADERNRFLSRSTVRVHEKEDA